ncbi:MAG: hypothetical protein J6U54_16080 [Clostridiales bacterium]|nr:hypothetical protein [Clostridiales bacterium]
MMAIVTIVDEDGCVIVENRRCEPQKEWINEGARTKTARFSFEITRVLLPQKSLLDEFLKNFEKLTGGQEE